MISSKSQDVTKYKLKKALSEMFISTALGFDFITNNIIQILIEDAKYEFMYIKLFSKCLQIRYFPAEWKKAKIILIPKASTMLDSVKAVRPIFLTSSLAKLFERIVLARITYYLELFGELANNQHTYRKGKFTESALYEMFDVVQYVTNRKEICMIVFLDISGAFDKTWHTGILHKLLSYGVPVYLVKWMEQSLHGRTAYFSDSLESHEELLE